MQPHELLGVRPGATRRELTEAFRRYALLHHPDRGGDRGVFQSGVDAYRRLLAAASPGASRDDAASRPGPADVVFHRRHRPGIPALLRLARRRLSVTRSRP